jgi:hypothetical protein
LTVCERFNRGSQLIRARSAVAAVYSVYELQNLVKLSTFEESGYELGIAGTAAAHKSDIGQKSLIDLKMNLRRANPLGFKDVALIFAVNGHLINKQLIDPFTPTAGWLSHLITNPIFLLKSRPKENRPKVDFSVE